MATCLVRGGISNAMHSECSGECGGACGETSRMQAEGEEGRVRQPCVLYGMVWYGMGAESNGEKAQERGRKRTGDLLSGDGYAYTPTHPIDRGGNMD